MLHKSIAVIPKRSDQKTSLGKHLRLIPNPKAALKKKRGTAPLGKLPFEATENDDNIKLASCILSNTIKVGKQVETEAANWFMDFLGKSFRNRSEETKSGQQLGMPGKFLSLSYSRSLIGWRYSSVIVVSGQCIPEQHR